MAVVAAQRSVELLGDAKYLGAKPGIIATLHTWTQTLILHPHIHGLVSGGGLSEAGHWGGVRNGFLLPIRVVMALFRGKLLAAIRQELAQGRLQLPEGKRPQPLDNLLNQLGRQKWNVHIRERYPHAVRVRCWGLYAHTQGAALARCRQQVGQGPIEPPEGVEALCEGAAWGQAPAERCPVCGQPLVCTALLPRAGVPPPAEPGWEQVA